MTCQTCVHRDPARTDPDGYHLYDLAECRVKTTETMRRYMAGDKTCEQWEGHALPEPV